MPTMNRARWLAAIAAGWAAAIATPAVLGAQQDTTEVEGDSASAEFPYIFRARLMSIPSDSIDFMVAGRIVSAEDGRPVPGVQVFLAGTTIGTLTDRRGRFRLDGGGAGPVELRTRLIGFDETCLNVELAAGLMRSLHIELPPGPGAGRSNIWLCRDPEVYEPPYP